MFTEWCMSLALDSRSFAQDSRSLALELYDLLRDLDPVRWRDELAGRTRDRLVAIEEGLAAAAEGHGESAREAMHTLALALREARPQTEGLGVAELREEWMAFRTQIQPTYEAFARSLRAADIHVPSLRPTNYTRNLFHVGGALIALGLIEMVLPASWLTYIAATIALLAWSMESSRRLSPAINRLLMKVFSPVAHPHEAHRVNSSTWFATALLITSLSGEAAVCAVAVVVLGLADPMAAIGGRRLGKTPLVNGRSLQGSLTFLAVGWAGAWGVLSTWHPELPHAGLVALGAALPATFAELFSRRIDDNLSIPLTAAAGAWLTMFVVG